MYVQELYADYSENKNYFAKTTKKKNEWWCTAFIAEHGYTPHRVLSQAVPVSQF